MAPTTKRQSFFLSLTLALMAVCLSTWAQANVQILDRIVAVVNDDVIMASELEQSTNIIASELRNNNVQLPPQEILRNQVLERMVMDKLQEELAERNGIRIDDSSLNQALANIASQNGLSLRDFSAAIEKDGVPWERFREEIRKEMLFSQLHQQAVGRRLQITDREVERFLDSEMGKQLFSAEIHLGHILIPVRDGATPDEVEKARNQANQIVKNIRSGARFHDQAVRYSAGNEAFQGGDLGSRSPAQWPTLFAEAASNMKVGDVSEPLRAGNGFHIIELKNRKGGENQLVTQYKVRHILITDSAVRTKNQAQQLIIRLHQEVSNGADFAALAKEHSNDPGSARDGGSLGWVNPGVMVPEFEDMYRKTPKGELSPIFQTQFGWHFLRVDDIRTTDMSDEYRRHTARLALQERRYEEELEQWLREMRNEAYVDIRL
ncbi:MAG TPA: peptidylprolyl isomerase [Alcanivoracaceae bacterium]|nr:peptidylprolyl isomerase [Alcanivoracaceae bacterium]